MSSALLEYFPLNPGREFDRAYDLLGFNWQTQAADFIIPDDDRHVLRVTFDNEVVVRLLDETWFNGEHYRRSARGFEAEHFAYRVEGSEFLENNADWIAESYGAPIHYRFITRWGSLDALSSTEPKFEIIPRASAICQSEWKEA